MLNFGVPTRDPLPGIRIEAAPLRLRHPVLGHSVMMAVMLDILTVYITYIFSQAQVHSGSVLLFVFRSCWIYMVNSCDTCSSSALFFLPTGSAEALCKAMDEAAFTRTGLKAKDVLLKIGSCLANQHQIDVLIIFE